MMVKKLPNRRLYWLRQSRESLENTMANLNESQGLTPDNDSFDAAIEAMLAELERIYGQIEIRIKDQEHV